MKKIITIAFLFIFPFFAFAEVQKTENGINANFSDITLEEALVEIANAFNIEIKTSGDLSEKINVGYSNVSLDKVFAALLDDYNTMYFRNEGTGEIESIRIFAGKGVVLPPPQEVAKQDGDKDIGQIPPEQLASAKDGGFYMNVGINGATLSYLVDTGASMLTVRQQEAYLMSLPVGEEVQISTANGKATGNLTTIAKFSMAGLELTDVEAVIVSDMNLQTGLIGQNILRNYHVVQKDGIMQIIPNRPNQIPVKDTAQSNPQNNNQASPQEGQQPAQPKTNDPQTSSQTTEPQTNQSESTTTSGELVPLADGTVELTN